MDSTSSFDAVRRPSALTYLVGAAIALAALGISAWSEVAFVIFTSAGAALAAADIAHALKSKQVPVRMWAAVLGTVVFPLAVYRWGESGIAFSLAGVLIGMGALLVAGGLQSNILRAISSSLLISVLIGILSGYAVLLRVFGGEKLIYAYALTLLGFLAGRFPGLRRIGGPSMAPSIPGAPPWSALATGVAGAIIGAALAIVFFIGSGVSVAVGLPFGTIVGIAATLGSIGGALIRADVGITEIESSVPGFGGVLARLDALLLSLPSFYYAFRLYLT